MERSPTCRRRTGFRLPPLALALGTAGALLASGAAPDPEPAGRLFPLPSFSLPDVHGHRRSLVDFRERPFLLFFWCGCSRCHAWAETWSRHLETAYPPGTPLPRTVVGYQGEAAQARIFAARHRLDRFSVLIPDPRAQLAERLGGIPCPRLLVVDGRGICRYRLPEGATPAPTGALTLDPVLRALRDCAERPIVPAAPVPETSAARGGQLTVLPVDGVRREEPSAGYWEFGEVDELDAGRLTHEFTLRNDNPGPVVVGGLDASCACSSAVVSPESGLEGSRFRSSAFPLTVHPGETVRVALTVDLRQLPGGPVHKVAWLFPTGSRSPLATLELSGRLRPALTFDPPLLAFGQLPALTGLSRQLKVRLAPRLSRALVPIRLLSSDPALHIVPESRPEPGKPSDTTGTEPEWGAAYQVTIPPGTPGGIVAGQLRFELPPRPATGAEASPDASAARRILERARVPFTGLVVTPVRAFPATLRLGTKPVRTVHRATVRLTGSATQPWRGVKVRSDNPWLRFRLREAGPVAAGEPLNRAGTSRLVEVEIAPQAPAGLLETWISVELEGSRLRLPFSVELVEGYGPRR